MASNKGPVSCGKCCEWLLLPGHVRVQTVHEIPSLTAWASFDGGDILELKPGYRNVPFEGPLDLASICSRVRDYPHTKTARLILDELNIPYLIIECVVVQIPECVAVE